MNKENHTTNPAAVKSCWHDYKELNDRETLIQLINTYGTINAIAAYLGCSRYMVSRAMKAHGIVKYKLIIPDDLRGKLEHLSSVAANVGCRKSCLTLHAAGI